MRFRQKRLLKNVKSGSLFRCVQCDFEKPENLRDAFANIPSMFKNNIVGGDNIGPLMKKFAEQQ